MPPHNSALDMLSVVMGANYQPRSGGRIRSSDVNNGVGGQIFSIAFLLASDVLAGVGLRSALRSFLRSHVSLIEFSTGVEVNIQQLEHPENPRSSNLLPFPLEDSRTEEKTQFTIKVKGLKNRGQTCYANSVLQALASLQPVCIYLNSLQQNVHRNTGSESISSALLQTLQYINGHESSVKRSARNSFLPFARLFSSSSSWDPQRIMDIVARHHSQFRSRNSMGMAGTLEQQDSHEFFSAMIDVLSSEDQGRENILKTRTIKKGLACCSSLIQSNESDGDISCESISTWNIKLGREQLESDCQFSNGSDHTTDGFKEEKKHEDQCIGGAASASGQQVGKGELTTGTLTAEECVLTSPNLAESSAESSFQNPFDGWCGSTIKCATCLHVRPIRSTPFLGLSLPIANIRSEFLEDFLASEYGGFASAEQVQDVQCFSCSIKQRISSLEEEEMLLSGAISSIQGRRKEKKIRNTVNQENDIVGLLQESQQIKRQIAIFESLDPDADDDKLEYNSNTDTQVPPLTPLRGDAYKASLIMRPPEVLCIHIQRRHYDISCQRMVKVMRHIRFGEELDIGEYCAYGGNSFENQCSFPAPGSNSAKLPYKLMSVIEHKGNAFGGHYQTYRRSGPRQNQWVLVSDESVSLRTWNDVKRCQAYMLFYVAISS